LSASLMWSFSLRTKLVSTPAVKSWSVCGEMGGRS
jgi:hypothetical protein